MAAHLQNILTQWYSQRDACRWVLGTVIHIEGSNYRKTGAMILINEWGQTLGLISGGCLEKSLLLQAKKALTFNKPRQVIYDSSPNADAPWASALGCGGKITLLLQPVDAYNHYHHLDQLHHALQTRTPTHYTIALNHTQRLNQLTSLQPFQPHTLKPHQNFYFQDALGHHYLAVAAPPQIHLAIFGGGLDAIPLAQMASVLGWHITLIEPRAGYALAAQFPAATRVVREPANAPSLGPLLNTLDAAIVMTHNIEQDAQALTALQASSARYIGLLGPQQRKQQVLAQAQWCDPRPIIGPMGLPIGGDLPESIALATLAQCHQALAQPSVAAHERGIPNLLLAGPFP